MKLIYKITVTMLCIIFVTALILSVYSFQVQRNLIHNQLIRKGQVLARVLSASVVNHLISYDFYAIKLLMDPLMQDADIKAVALIGPDGYIKMHSDMRMIGEPSEYEFSEKSLSEMDVIFREIIQDQQKRYLFASSVEIDHDRIGIIQITMSDKESLLVIESFGMKMLLLTAAVLFLAALASYVMSRQISNPLIELTEDINRFMMNRSAGGLQSSRSNEVTDLKNNFTYMMKELQNSIEFRVKTEKMAVLGSLSSVLAHEVKNPLEPIKGSAEMLKIKYPGNADIIKYTDIIQSEVSDLISFLDSFLDVSRMHDLAMEPLDINKVVSEVLALMEYSLKKEHFDTEVQLDSDLPRVWGNSGMLKQVFLNLLINAIQAKNVDYGFIELQSFLKDGIVCVRIKDYGAGIDESIREQIFQPFYSTKKDGTGIGLSTSRHIIGLHNGNISIDSELESWTEFLIQLPPYGEQKQ